MLRVDVRVSANNDTDIFNHLHDSIQFHPNNYNLILDAITEIYTTSNLGDSLDKCSLNNLANNLINLKYQENMKNILQI